ncbi:MAG: NUMOD3 domain-containing DNA-binding protein [Candidatus Woesearchaeota archaeon]
MGKETHLSDSLVKCMLCNRLMKRVTNSHLKRHKIDFILYRDIFPNSEIASIKSREKQIIAMTGKKLSEQTKQKLSIAHKGKKIPEEMRRRISQTQQGRKKSKEALAKLKAYYRTHDSPMKGKKHTPEAKRKISEAGLGRVPHNKGKKLPKEMKRRISKKLRGIKLKLETRKKMSLAQKGKVLSEITKERISKAKKGKPMTIEHRRKLLKSRFECPNKFEKKCINLFKENNLPLKFVGDLKDEEFYIDGKIPDFVSTNDKKIIVEVFHDYYKIRRYGSIENYKKDREKIFSKYGWRTLFVTLDEINSNPQECLNKIKEELI